MNSLSERRMRARLASDRAGAAMAIFFTRIDSTAHNPLQARRPNFREARVVVVGEIELIEARLPPCASPRASTVCSFLLLLLLHAFQHWTEGSICLIHRPAHHLRAEMPDGTKVRRMPFEA